MLFLHTATYNHMGIGISTRHLRIYSQNVQCTQAAMDPQENYHQSAPAQTEMLEGGKDYAFEQSLSTKAALKLRLADRSIPRTLNVGEAFSTGWTLFWQHPGAYVAWTLVVLLARYAVTIPALLFLSPPPSQDPLSSVADSNMTQATTNSNILFLINVITTVALAPLGTGPFIVASNSLRLRGSGFRLSNLYITPYKYFGPLLLLGLLIEVCVFFGTFLFIIPGLYLLVTLMFSYDVYIEYHSIGMGIVESMLLSRKVSHRVFFKIVLLMLASLFIYILGALFFFVGVLVALPVILLAWAAAFHQVFSMNDEFDGNPTDCICCC